MIWFSTLVTLIALSLMTYALYLVFPPLALFAGGVVLLRAAWNLDEVDK